MSKYLTGSDALGESVRRRPSNHSCIGATPSDQTITTPMWLGFFALAAAVVGLGIHYMRGQ